MHLHLSGLWNALSFMGCQGEAMTCQATIHLICDYLEGRLPPAVVREISSHLGKCRNCSKVLDAAEQTLEVYFDADPLLLPHPQAS